MLNYVWLALLVLGIGVALTYDIIDESQNTYANGVHFEAMVKFDANFNPNKKDSYNSQIIIKSSQFNKVYKTNLGKDVIQTAKISVDPDKNKITVFFKTNSETPEIWKKIAKVSGEKDDITGEILALQSITDKQAKVKIKLEKVSFLKMKEVTNSALEYAGIAVNIALGLIGIMALWLGVMKVAEEAGLIKIIANAVKPVTKFLFPDIPADHPAMGAMIMNISANMLGLGNAATPFGLKAMEELDKLNPEKGTATNAMCTFLTVNTAGLTLIPATAIAVRAAAGSTDPAIIIGTSVFGASCATIVGIIAAKIFEKFSIPGFSVIKSLKTNFRKISIFFGVVILFTIAFSVGLGRLLSPIFSFITPDLFKNIIQIISILATNAYTYFYRIWCF